MADRYLLESSAVDGYQLEDASGVLLLEGLDVTPVITPVRPVVRPYARAAYVLALAFVPLIAAATDAAPGVQGGTPPLRQSLLQYQAVTGPVLVPVAAETVTLDKWASQPPGRPRLEWRPTGGTVAPLYVPDVTQPVTARSWAPTYPDRAPGKPRAVDFPQAVAPLFVPDVTQPVTARAWAPVYPDRVNAKPRAADFPQSFAPVLTEAPAEVITLDKWHSPWVPRPRLSLRPEGGTVAPLHVPDVTQPVTARSWAPTYPDRVPAKPRAVELPQSVAPVETPAPAEVITLDKWHAAPALRFPVQTRPTGGTVAPLFVADVTDPAPDRSWSAITPDVVRARVLPPLGGIVTPVEPVAAPAATDAAPGVQGGTPPLRSTTTQYQALTGPVLVPGEAPPAVPFDWASSLPSGPFAKDGPAIQYAPLTGPVETVIETGWLRQSPDVVRRPRVVTGGVVAPVDIPAPPVPAPDLSWAPVWPQPTRRVIRPSGGTVVPLGIVADTGNRRRRVLLSEAPMIIARQSTARTVMVGPVLDASGVAVTDGVVADFKVSKNGGVPAALNASATLTHRHTGFYSLALTATDLDTVGQAEIVIDDTVNAAPVKDITVIEEAVYDITFTAAATGAVPSVTGAVGSVTGNIGGNVVGTVASIAAGGIAAASFAAGAINAAAIAADAITDAKVAADVTIASVTGSVGSVVGAVGSVTGAVGSVTGAVGSVTGNVGGNVVGSVNSVAGAVGSVAAAVTVGTNNDKTGYAIGVGGIASAAFAAGALDAAALAADAGTEIAAAVLAAATANPIDANIQEVNDTLLQGNGQVATPWGPV